MGKHVTAEMLNRYDSFLRIVEVGDTVDDEIVEALMNACTPRAAYKYYFQMGEVFSHSKDESGKIRATYSIFGKDDPRGKWKFCGNCFYKERVDRTAQADPWIGVTGVTLNI